MQYYCSQCHRRWAVEGDEAPPACPRCKAEAGLESKAGIPFPMRAFGFILGGAIVLALVGTVLTFARGG